LQGKIDVTEKSNYTCEGVVQYRGVSREKVVNIHGTREFNANTLAQIKQQSLSLATT